jgi:cellulose synthase/poly-beta-1,6-N-acetylglucosamine synthase-like glycosyltransferase
VRRDIVPSLPDDVVADDVHTAFRASKGGYRVAFLRADVTELRAPASLSEMLRHKHRKADAYLREVLRFDRPMPTHALRTFREIFGSSGDPAPLGSRLGLAAILGIALLTALATLPFRHPRARFSKIDSKRIPAS